MLGNFIVPNVPTVPSLANSLKIKGIIRGIRRIVPASGRNCRKHIGYSEENTFLILENGANPYWPDIGLVYGSRICNV